MDKKTFIKNTKQGCRGFGKNASVRKECENATMCRWDKCQQEVIDTHNARITDEERQSCHNKDFMKQFNCQEKLTKKKGLQDKMAMEEHCVANKCPQLNEFIKKIGAQVIKQFKSKRNSKSKFAAIDECLHKNCSKEQEDEDKTEKQKSDKRYECVKTYKTKKEQDKCSEPSLKQSKKSREKFHKCREKHCDAKISNKGT